MFGSLYILCLLRVVGPYAVVVGNPSPIVVDKVVRWHRQNNVTVVASCLSTLIASVVSHSGLVSFSVLMSSSCGHEDETAKQVLYLTLMDLSSQRVFVCLQKRIGCDHGCYVE
jgi:hypothetical protein